MPSPRLGLSPYSGFRDGVFIDDDPFGWYITEIQEEYELKPGFLDIASQIMEELLKLGSGKPAYRIAGHQGRNLEGNIYWPPELASKAGQLSHERYVVLLPLALSKTQDDKGRVQWTFFGASEQGPEHAFWKSFYTGPSQERPAEEAIEFLSQLLSQVYGEKCHDSSSLFGSGFRILPTASSKPFPHWCETILPAWTNAFLWDENTFMGDVRYLLTFRPFSLLPPTIRERYLNGKLMLLPFPGSLVFWGMKSYIHLQAELPMALQIPMQRLVKRHNGQYGVRVPQSGRFHEPGSDLKLPEVEENLLLNTYRRTSRWDRASLTENDMVIGAIEDTVARVLFSTQLSVMGLYGKPMAKNSQLWTADSHLLLDGPAAVCGDLDKAAAVVARGGTFRYRFQFPPMRVGLYEVYWQRPLVAFWDTEKGEIGMPTNVPLGYLTAYQVAKVDLAHPVELWPRLLRRNPFLYALRNFEFFEERYSHKTAMNILRILDTCDRWGKPIPRSFARQILWVPEHETLESWLTNLPGRASNTEEGQKLLQDIERCLEPEPERTPSHTTEEMLSPDKKLHAITYGQTATRAFEVAWWSDILKLSHGDFVNKENADCVHDAATLALLTHRHRDLESLGDYLLRRHMHAINAAQMENKALCGEIIFHWNTDFDFSEFGGWKNNQEGHTHERNLLVIIPGKNHNEAILMADHYDTAYMEDLYDKSPAGEGARLASAGADDNCSATATLLQAAPVFLKLSQKGLLERDIWLVHLTGEEFPSDCMGARHLAQALIQKGLYMRQTATQIRDLSEVKVVGVYLMDMIGHNRDNEKDIFQISPGKDPMSLRSAWQAHLASILWNAETKKWNQSKERNGKEHGKRSSDGETIPQIASFLPIQGEVRLIEDTRSTLFNTDGQIFSDTGIPVVLFMENYDINRSGYHDTKDTMQNIDLDYGSAFAAIAIETVARAATLP